MQWRNLLLISGITSLCLGIIGWMLWVWLPTWAPEFVFENSPFMDMQLRSIEYSQRYYYDDFFEEHKNVAIPTFIKFIKNPSTNQMELDQAIESAAEYITDHNNDIQECLYNIAISKSSDDELKQTAILYFILQKHNYHDCLFKLSNLKQYDTNLAFTKSLISIFSYDSESFFDKYILQFDSDLFFIFINVLKNSQIKDRGFLYISLLQVMHELNDINPKQLSKLSDHSDLLLPLLKEARTGHDKIYGSTSLHLASIILNCQVIAKDMRINGIDSFIFEVLSDAPDVHQLSRSTINEISKIVDESHYKINNKEILILLENGIYPDSITERIISEISKKKEASFLHEEYLTRAGPRLIHKISEIENLSTHFIRFPYLPLLIRSDNNGLISHCNKTENDRTTILDCIMKFPKDIQRKYIPLIKHLHDSEMELYQRDEYRSALQKLE